MADDGCWPAPEPCLGMYPGFSPGIQIVGWPGDNEHVNKYDIQDMSKVCASDAKLASNNLLKDTSALRRASSAILCIGRSTESFGDLRILRDKINLDMCQSNTFNENKLISYEARTIQN